MDKQTAKLAEQVGLFLLPLLKDSIAKMVEASVAKSMAATEALLKQYDESMRLSRDEVSRVCAEAISKSNNAMKAAAEAAGLVQRAKEDHAEILRRAEDLSSSLHETDSAIGQAGTLINRTAEELATIRRNAEEDRRKLLDAVRRIDEVAAQGENLHQMVESTNTDAAIRSAVNEQFPKAVELLMTSLPSMVKVAVEALPTIKGDKGDPGERGERGLQGERGEKGDKGDKGDPGERGPQGERGEKGEKGDQGERGLQGEKGDKGDTGERGERGLQGERGEKGDAGERGEKGLDGKDGCDGTFTMINQYVEGKVYEPLALVSHSGGVWQAMRPTKAAPAPDSRDWQMVVAGVSDVELDAEEEGRTLTVAFKMSDGSVRAIRKNIPTLIYRKVYAEDGVYSKMDVVTHAGGIWAAEKDNPQGAPGMSNPDWRLIVKRGNDGRNGQDGKPGSVEYAGYAGEYKEDKIYRKDSIVEYASSIWVAKRATKNRPPYLTGESDDHWLRIR